ncbi:NrdH-redoxin [Arenibacter sp. TNZ]|uniref:glutaredoxin family protein n=1 Tax=Arenibacter TaxID=178469 RepID=UPI000CD48617|nr:MULTISPECIES: glutaredoxin domain-containing protein [Arenibacter]MCM4172873.1 NrdH-redoxin [Arenibacter sp. TNZ]
MDKPSPITIYGAKRCHKTQFYKDWLESHNLPFIVLDVEMDYSHAQELRNLYVSRKLYFPTITVGSKRLRNPTKKELNKWMTI